MNVSFKLKLKLLYTTLWNDFVCHGAVEALSLAFLPWVGEEFIALVSFQSIAVFST